MSKVLRLPDDVIDLISDVKRIMLNDYENANDFAYQIIDNMSNVDIIRHCLNSVKCMYLEK